MFVLVNCSDAYGMDHCGNFNTHKEAYEYIARDVSQYYDGFNLMEIYPFDGQNNSLVYENNDMQVRAGYNWCSCYDDDYSDKWLIIKV